MRLIDADLLRKNMEFVCMGIMAGTEPYNAPLTEIDNAPAVETKTTHDVNSAYDKGFITAMKAYSAPRGEWIETQRGIHVTDYKCSCCGRTVRDDTGYNVANDYPFCHCGADMRGKAYEEDNTN